ncbi:hypothetical protein AAG570_011964 [Ranatra chinensis]|uniref:Abasic site processing protein HMCES n=1 Tax=Ranatra chinensis TaxID=642074 RepID=A0ABD0YZR7_9HEMI
MCGRTSCCLCREVYQHAANYFDDKLGKYVKPYWNEVSNNGLKFQPSTNIAPTDVTPVLISGARIDSRPTEQVLQPMMWGLIPPWHKGDYRTHKLTTNNCRIEGLMKSKLYRPSLDHGKRCVVLCEGFYEWQKTKGSKQPYFIYSHQNTGFKMEDKLSWVGAEWTEDKGWMGPHLLYMAGIYGTWESSEGEIIYSYSIITMDSNESFGWIHERMPAILSSPEQIQGWLDYERVSPGEAVSLLEPVKVLSWYPVSTLVNNSRNKDPTCIKPIQLK